MRRLLANRVERLESQTNHGFDRMIPVTTEAEAKACRAWWRKENPGVPDHKLLIVITGVPRNRDEPWNTPGDE